MDLIEAIGYLGSILIALSLTMHNIRWLRWINLAGARRLYPLRHIATCVPSGGSEWVYHRRESLPFATPGKERIGGKLAAAATLPNYSMPNFASFSI